MNKPYIICHMVASIDGRIDCSMVDKISGDEYYTTLDALQCPSRLEGRVTIAHYTALPQPFIAHDSTPVGEESVYMATKAEGYTIAVDTRGQLRFPDNVAAEGPFLVISSQQAPREYLDTLRQHGISYIATGCTAIHLPRAMELLHDTFGVEKMSLLGGGHINGGFLTEGLIDEVSLLLAPGIDGRQGQTALFDGIADATKLPTQLSLASAEQLDSGILWLRYKVRN